MALAAVYLSLSEGLLSICTYSLTLFKREQLSCCTTGTTEAIIWLSLTGSFGFTSGCQVIFRRCNLRLTSLLSTERLSFIESELTAAIVPATDETAEGQVSRISKPSWAPLGLSVIVFPAPAAPRRELTWMY